MRLTEVLRTSGLRITGYFLVVFGASSLAVTGFIYGQTRHFLTHQTDEWLARESRSLTRDTPEQRAHALTQHLQNDSRQVRPFVLFDAEGHVVLGESVALPTSIHHGRATSFRLTLNGQEDEYRGIIVDLSNRQTLLVSESAQAGHRFSRKLIWRMAVGTVFIISVGFAAAFYLGWSTLRRIDRMASSTQRIVSGQLTERLPRNGRLDDLDRLGGVVNGMLDEIERLVSDVKGVCDGIAHDLRTPLTRLLAGLERTRRRATNVEELQSGLEAAVEETNGILARFSAMLRISEIEDGMRRSGFCPVDLVQIARDASEFYEPLAATKNVTLVFHQLENKAPLKINGDRSLIFDAIGNLIDNAIKASPDGAVVSLNVGARDGSCWIEITDAGPGIPADQREAVLRRFYRLDTDTKTLGSGLGLSLVSAVVRLHGMTLTISDANPGCRICLLKPNED